MWQNVSQREQIAERMCVEGTDDNVDFLIVCPYSKPLVQI